MKGDRRFNEAIKRIDEANAEDPRRELFQGRSTPRELLFARRVYEWVERLVEDPSEELLLAARAHTLRRWSIPRDSYPMTTVGYHTWRDALAEFHAVQAENILREAGYDDGRIDRVKDFITRRNWPQDAEACALEDADCLVFLESKLAGYLDAWEQVKTVRILKRTLRKMTPAARALVAQLELGQRERELLERLSQEG